MDKLKSPKSLVKKYGSGIKWSSVALNGINIAAGAYSIFAEDEKYAEIEEVIHICGIVRGIFKFTITES